LGNESVPLLWANDTAGRAHNTYTGGSGEKGRHRQRRGNRVVPWPQTGRGHRGTEVYNSSAETVRTHGLHTVTRETADLEPPEEDSSKRGPREQRGNDPEKHEGNTRTGSEESQKSSSRGFSPASSW